MKKLVIFLCLMAVSFAASAQYVSASVDLPMNIKGTRVYIGDEVLTLDQASACFADVNGVDRSGEYLIYRKGYRTGAGLLIGGASAVTLGSLTFLGSAVAALVVGVPLSIAGKDIPVGINVGIYSGIGFTAAGAGLMIAGIPTICVYNKRLKGLAGEYNGQSVHPQLTFGPTSNGLGFALNF